MFFYFIRTVFRIKKKANHPYTENNRTHPDKGWLYLQLKQVATYLSQQEASMTIRQKKKALFVFIGISCLFFTLVLLKGIYLQPPPKRTVQSQPILPAPDSTSLSHAWKAFQKHLTDSFTTKITQHDSGKNVR